MTKEIIIIALIVLAIYLYYQQNNQSLPMQPNRQEIQDLKQQAQHYQTLYQRRVEKDLATDQSQKIKQLENNLATATEKNQLYTQKIGGLETQLFTLAKQKITNQKQASALLNQLENNWQADKKTWEKEKTNLITTYQQEQEKQASNLAQERKDFHGQIERLNQVNQELTTKYNQLETNWKQEKEVFEQELTNLFTTSQQEIKQLKEKVRQQIETASERYEKTEKKLTEEIKKISNLEKQLAVEKEARIDLQEALREEEKHRDRNHEMAKQAGERVKEKNEELKLAQEKIKELERKNLSDEEEYFDLMPIRDDSSEKKKS